MGFRRSILVSLAIVMTMTIPGMTNIASPVNGVSGPGSSNFKPAGPSVDNLLMSVFTTASSEYNAFLAQFAGSQIDIPDVPVPPGLVSTITSSSNLVITPSTRTSKVYGLEFNQAGQFLGMQL